MITFSLSSKVKKKFPFSDDVNAVYEIANSGGRKMNHNELYKIVLNFMNRPRMMASKILQKIYSDEALAAMTATGNARCPGTSKMPTDIYNAVYCKQKLRNWLKYNLYRHVVE